MHVKFTFSAFIENILGLKSQSYSTKSAKVKQNAYSNPLPLVIVAVAVAVALVVVVDATISDKDEFIL